VNSRGPWTCLASAALTLFAFPSTATAAVLPAAPAARTAAPSSSTASASIIKGGNFARDCITQPFLDRSRRNRIRFVVWCSVQSGGVRFTLRRRDRATINGFSRSIAPTGSGVFGSFHCRRAGETVKCAGHKHGPLVVRGWLQVPAETRCDPLLAPTDPGIFVGPPQGCPHTHRQRVNFSLGYMRSFRHELGFDVDLGEDQEAIDRRIHSIIGAWRRGEPVARVTATELGQPLRPVDQRRFEFREALLERTASALEHWVPRHAESTYAGYWIDDQDPQGPIIYVGFVGDQDSQLAAFKQQLKLIAPEHIRPFPVAPRYSERALGDLEEALWHPFHSALTRLISSTGIDTTANKLEVGTEHVAKVKRLLADRFGPDAPFLVVFERPGTLL
jgi:hypothetical protein